MTNGEPQSNAWPSITSLSLLERVRAHDQNAWERLVRLYTPLVYAWCRRGGVQPADAADVGQEVLRAVFRKIGSFRRERPGDTFRGWLHTITRNKLRDYARKRQTELAAIGGSDALNRLLLVPAEEPAHLDADSDAAEKGLLYRRALEIVSVEFNQRSWQAFWQVVIEEHEPTEVARCLDMSVNAIYLAKSRILRRLREEFADLVEI